MGHGTGTRLVGVELFAERAGDSATFYSWLLGPGSGSSATDWNPVSLLFDHGVCGIHVAGHDTPRPSWVPVLAVPDPAATIARAERERFTHTEREGRTYLVHGNDWLRLVPTGRLPHEINTTALGSTTVEWQSRDAPGATERLSRTLGLDAFQVVDEPSDYLLLVDDGTLNLGVVDFTPLSPGLEDTWLVYFDVPDIELTISRTTDAGIEVLVPPTDEGYAVWSVLRDPFGVAFALCTYSDLRDSGRMVRDTTTDEIFPIGDKLRQRFED